MKLLSLNVDKVECLHTIWIKGTKGQYFKNYTNDNNKITTGAFVLKNKNRVIEYFYWLSKIWNILKLVSVWH